MKIYQCWDGALSQVDGHIGVQALYTHNKYILGIFKQCTKLPKSIFKKKICFTVVK